MIAESPGLAAEMLEFLEGHGVSAWIGSAWDEPAVAGQFYPGDPAELGRFLDEALESAPADDAVRALIVPHAGYVYSGKTAGKAFAKVRPGNCRRVLIIAPTHRHAFTGRAADL